MTPDTRVLFVQGAGERAGAERALLARLRHLPEHGIDPTVAFLANGPFRAEVEWTGVRTLALGDAPHARELMQFPSAVAELASVARREGHDALEGCGEKMSMIAGWAARLAGCGCVHNLQDAPRRDIRTTLVQLAAASGRHDAVVVPSRWMARAFDHSLHLSTRVIPNAVVLDDLPRAPADVRALAGWPASSSVVGLFGRLVAWKGGEVLLRAAKRLYADNPDVRFLIVGGSLYGLEPGYEGRLRALSRDLGLGDRVHFTGHREDALSLMAGCSAVAHCSWEPEPFGMVVLEAMALGLPIVATRSGGPEELLEHGRTGLLVEPGDPVGLAGELAALLADPERGERLGEAARSEARGRFSSANFGPMLASLYREVAARHRVPVR